MADDIFTDDEQWEKVKRWWKANGTFIITGVVIAAAIIGGWRWYTHYQNQQRLEASSLYYQFAQAWGTTKHEGAEAIAKNLIKNFDDTPYAAQVSLVLAAKEAGTNNFEQATVHLQWVLQHANDTSVERLARLRLARVQIAQHQADAAIATLASGTPGAFLARYNEVRGDAYRAAGHFNKAHAAYQTAYNASDSSSPARALLKMKLQQTASGAGAEHTTDAS